jgi:hypothetical protein
MKSGRTLLCWVGVLAAVAAAAEPESPLALSISPAEIRSADTRTWAERLVRRIHERCDAAGAPDPAGRRPGSYELIMMVPAEALASIRARGFLNQHQTLATKGFDRLSARFEAEQELAMLRLPYGREGRELLPKYAVLNIRRRGYGAFFLPARYGSVAIVFKRKVEARTTWTYADSLDFSRKSGRYSQGGAANPVLARTTLYAGNAADRNECGNYCEAQIWGKLTWDDVESVMISTGDSFPAALADAGVPVYRYRAQENPGQTAQYVRGSRVAPPRAGPSRGDEPPEPGVVNFLKGESDAAQTDEELARNAAEAPPGDPERARLLGDLAERPASPSIAAALKTLSSAADAPARALALGGLSALPWREFKPFLLTALNDRETNVLIQAVSLAAAHRGDADVAAGLDALRGRIARRRNDPMDAGAGDIQEWLDRASAGKLCGR